MYLLYKTNQSCVWNTFKLGDDLQWKHEQKVDEMGIDQMGIDQMGVDQVVNYKIDHWNPSGLEILTLEVGS